MKTKNGTIDCRSSEYPYLLKQIKDPPEILYFRGSWDSSLFEKTLAVAGARRMTAYGSIMTETLLSPLAARQVTIISGFMYGIDARAHETALESGGRTIAVMPCGIDRIHPEYQKKLHTMIQEQGGLIISEYPEETRPALWSFPRRNRIIIGLSENLLVVEAGLKSGSLNTASLAERYCRKVYAVPGPLTSSVSRGTALLIQRGAAIVTGKQDLLSVYGITDSETSLIDTGRKGLTETQGKILQIVSAIPLGIDEIARASGQTASQTGAVLTLMVMKNILDQKEGKYYIKRSSSYAY